MRNFRSRKITQRLQACLFFLIGAISLSASTGEGNVSSEKISVQQINGGRLNLCCRELDQVPSFLHGNRAITKLNLARNIIRLDKEDVRILSSMPRLEEVNLSENLIDYESEGLADLFNISQLKAIYLDSNNLNKLPNTAGSSVESLTLSKNRFEKIPCELHNLRKLKGLDLSHHKFGDIAAEFTCLPATLIELDLSYCSLGNMPSGISRLPQLEFLFLNNNNIKAIGTDIWRHPSLKKVYLKSNPVEELSVPLLNTNRELALKLDSGVKLPIWRRYPIMGYLSMFMPFLILVILFMAFSARHKKAKDGMGGN